MLTLRVDQKAAPAASVDMPSKQELLQFYHQMVLVRRFEQTAPPPLEREF